MVFTNLKVIVLVFDSEKGVCKGFLSFKNGSKKVFQDSQVRDCHRNLSRGSRDFHDDSLVTNVYVRSPTLHLQRERTRDLKNTTV